MIKNPPADGCKSDELWFLGVRPHRQADNIAWRMLVQGFTQTYAARFGTRWFVVYGLYSGRRAVEVASLEAAMLAWRIMK